MTIIESVECYVSLLNGQIVPPGQAAVPGSDHVLIIPISHNPRYSTIPPDLVPSTLEDTDKIHRPLISKFWETESWIHFFI